MSKKIFSAQDWENVPSEMLQTHTPDIAPIYNKVKGIQFNIGCPYLHKLNVRSAFVTNY